MKSTRSPIACIGDSAGDLRYFDMTVHCAVHNTGATLNHIPSLGSKKSNISFDAYLLGGADTGRKLVESFSSSTTSSSSASGSSIAQMSSIWPSESAGEAGVWERVRDGGRTLADRFWRDSDFSTHMRWSKRFDGWNRKKKRKRRTIRLVILLIFQKKNSLTYLPYFRLIYFFLFQAKMIIISWTSPPFFFFLLPS